MMKRYINVWMLLMSTLLFACSKDFLDKKPSSGIVVPKTLPELQSLLDNQSVMNVNGGMGQASCDDYVIASEAEYLSVLDRKSKRLYVWDAELFAGESNIQDWNALYKTVFYANNVIKELGANTYLDAGLRDQLLGQALFHRAYAYFDLLCTFSKVYRPESAGTDLGVPLRLDPAVDYVAQRATVAQCYQRIFSDLEDAGLLMSGNVVSASANRPSKTAVFALLARIYLYRGEYELAETAADSCLARYKKLISFSGLSQTAVTPIRYVNDETIFYAAQVPDYYELTETSASVNPYRISEELMASYQPDDSRKSVFFLARAEGGFSSKRRFSGGNFPFSGLTTSELYLVKAECLARRGNASGAMAELDLLLFSRFKAGKYVNQVLGASELALDRVLFERRKELVFRGQRWNDLKRLNREGRNLVLSRTVGAANYVLKPADPRYVFPIPPDEIALSGLIQNQR